MENSYPTYSCLGPVLVVVNPSLAWVRNDDPFGQTMAQKFELIAFTVIIIWDIMQSLPADYRLVFKQKFTMKSFVFVLSRISTLAYFIFTMVLLNLRMLITHLGVESTCTITGSVSKQSVLAIQLSAGVAFVICRSSTSLLLYFRGAGVYGGSGLVVGVFRILWVLLLGMNITTLGPIGILSPPYAVTTYIFMPLLVVSTLLELINDTFIFMAIAWKLDAQAVTGKSGRGWRNVFSLNRKTSKLQRFTAAFLQESQVYYLTVVFVNIVTIIFFFSMSMRHGRGDTFALNFNTLLVHIMATKVHRDLKLGGMASLSEPLTSAVGGSLGFARSGGDEFSGMESRDRPSINSSHRVSLPGMVGEYKGGVQRDLMNRGMDSQKSISENKTDEYELNDRRLEEP